ncbi:MAG TPA: carboxypeptidase-like regulatory domain-containing protein [Blastocatellia bacterium]|nr:carboxypeptidase-like regulatory domain-containing protein [Blastocatellia bacterium]
MNSKRSHVIGAGLGAAAALFVLFAAQTARAQTVSGEVLDCTGRVLRDVTVELYKVTTPGGTRTVSGGVSGQTDKGGYFRFPTSGGTLTPGTYYVVVKCPRNQGGLVLQSNEFYLSAGFTTGNTISLKFICCPTIGSNAVLRRTDVDNVVPEFTPFGGLVESVPPPRPPGAPVVVGNVEFVHTGDWQPGDQVSFTVRGKVVDDKAGRQADLTGHVVKIEDPSGKQRTVAWSPLIRYTVSAAVGRITASLLNPNGTVLSRTTIPVNPAGTPAPYQTVEPPTGTCVAPALNQIGQPFQIYSPNNQLAQGDIELVVRNEANGASEVCKPVAVSPHSAIFEPKGETPGRHTFTVRRTGALQEVFTVYRLLVGLDTKRLQNVGKKGTVTVEVSGFPLDEVELRKLLSFKPTLRITNNTPDVLAFTKDPSEFSVKLDGGGIEGGTFRRDILTKAIRAGDFEIKARTELIILLTPRIIKQE